MKLPNAEHAIIAREKLANYLLNSGHRYGESKARFFISFGFQMEDWETMAAAFREHAAHHEVAKVKQTPFGPRYEIDGEVVAPDGRTPRIRAVWQVDDGEVAPRLITAYPLEAL